MSDLNLNITAEEQNELEQKLVGIVGGSIINTDGSVSSQLISELLTAQQKPANLEELLASQEVYGNVVQKLFGVDQTILAAEKVKLYHGLKSMIENFEQQMAAQAAEKNESVVAEDGIPEEIPDASDINAAIEKVEEAKAVAKESVAKAAKVTQISKKNAPAKKAPAKKSTKSISNTKNN